MGYCCAKCADRLVCYDIVGLPPLDWPRVVPSIRAPESNNRIERMNGGQKDRTKTMRAYDNLGGASALSEGWRVNYNLIRNHMALGTTPGVAAGLPELGGFRWLSLIELAASRKVTDAPEGL